MTRDKALLEAMQHAYDKADCGLTDAESPMLAALSAAEARGWVVTGPYTLPCDVLVPPSTIIRKGCQLSTLVVALRVREGKNLTIDRAIATAIEKEPD